jgi:hypothetical protein
MVATTRSGLFVGVKLQAVASDVTEEDVVRLCLQRKLMSKRAALVCAQTRVARPDTAIWLFLGGRWSKLKQTYASGAGASVSTCSICLDRPASGDRHRDASWLMVQRSSSHVDTSAHAKAAPYT